MASDGNGARGDGGRRIGVRSRLAAATDQRANGDQSRVAVLDTASPPTPATQAHPTSDEAPQPAAPVKFGYQGSLDGLRALALLAIIAYHLDYGWAKGAFLSVDLFFILSGFLITTLLIVEWRRKDRIALGTFWARRARRLIPALLLTVAAVAVFTRLEIDPWNRAGVRNDGLASLFYVANWRFIADKQGYFGLFSAPSPLRHMWTLAIEEQFYLVWPGTVYIAMRLGRGTLRVLTAVCVLGIAASVTVMAAVRVPGTDPLRAYYGTDARVHTILVGAMLAILLAVWRPSPAAARRLAAIGIVGFGIMMISWLVATGSSPRYYYGGSLVYALLGGLVIAAAQQAGLLQRMLAVGPLAWIGRLSYGLYLFHWPIIVWLVPSRVHIDGLALDALRVGLTFALATVSFYLIELPIRERRVPQFLHRVAALRHRQTPLRSPKVAKWLALPATGLTVAVVFASAGGATPPPSYLVGERPSVGNVVWWNVGDPLYCGTPRLSETKQAVDTARRFGPPKLNGSASGLRILLLGDSTACSLYPGLAAVGHELGADVEQASVFGCGIASGEITTTRNEQITPHSGICPTMVGKALTPALENLKPNIVVWMSIWEKSRPTPAGSGALSCCSVNMSCEAAIRTSSWPCSARSASPVTRPASTYGWSTLAVWRSRWRRAPTPLRGDPRAIASSST